MYAYIKGVLEEKLNDSVIIETGGIGYKVFMSNFAVSAIGEVGDSVKVFTHYHVREDNISLYGFLSNEELKMFELLISVSGIGAKSAISMLSKISPSDFAISIVNNDITSLTSVPGIGKKSAERIILELKDKLKTSDEIIVNKEKSKTLIENSGNVEDAISALRILGYNQKEIEKVLEKFDYKSMSVEDIIRNGLKLLSK